MDGNRHVSRHDHPEVEDRLRTITVLCVESLISRGIDFGTVRHLVLRMAGNAIREMSTDAYQEETHLAVVQRTVDTILSGRTVRP